MFGVDDDFEAEGVDVGHRADDVCPLLYLEGGRVVVRNDEVKLGIALVWGRVMGRNCSGGCR